MPATLDIMLTLAIAISELNTASRELELEYDEKTQGFNWNRWLRHMQYTPECCFICFKQPGECTCPF